MMGNTQKPAAYLGIKLDEDGDPKTFAINREIDKAIEWAENDQPAREAEKKTPSDNDQPPESIEDDKENPLKNWMEKISHIMMPYYSLIDLGSKVKFIFMFAHTHGRIIGPIAKNQEAVKSGDKWRVYSLDSSQMERMRKELDVLDRISKGTEALPGSTLMSLVAAFDSAMAELISALFKLKKEKLNIKDKSVPISDIVNAKDLDQVIDRFISNQVYELLKGSHDDQIKFIEERFDISIRTHWANWADFIEVFERRNLVAHGEKRFTERYVEVCGKHGNTVNVRKEGEDILLEKPYLRHAVDVLLEFCVLLSFSLWRKHSRDEEDSAFQSLNNIAFSLIKEERLRTAENILNFALGLKKTGCSETVRRMMIVNRANALKKLGRQEDCLSLLDEIDWRAASDNFRICVAAIREDVQAAIALMEIVKVSGSVGKREFRDWPVFDHVRFDPQFQQEFARLFGEPLINDLHADGPGTKAGGVEEHSGAGAADSSSSLH